MKFNNWEFYENLITVTTVTLITCHSVLVQWIHSGRSTKTLLLPPQKNRWNMRWCVNVETSLAL